MKKQVKTLFAFLSFSLTILSCKIGDLQVPKEVRLKTKAKYEFSVMDFDSSKSNGSFKLSEYFDLGKTLEEKAGSSDKFKIYKYNGSDYQEFLIHMQLADIEFNFADSIKNMDFTKIVDGFDIEKTITVPNVGDMSRSTSIDVSAIKTAVKNSVRGSGNTSDDSTVSFAALTGDDHKFGEIDYKTGKLVIKGTSGAIEGTVQMWDGSDWGDPVSFNNNTAEINLTGKTIKYEGTRLKFSDNGGKAYSAIPSANSDFDVVRGLVLTGEYTPVVSVSPLTFSISISDDVKSCTVTNGSFTIGKPTPDGWAPEILNKIDISLKGGLEEDVYVTYSDNEKDFTLNGTTLSKEDITATTKVTLDLNNRDVNFANSPVVSVRVNINKVSATVQLPDDYETSTSAPQSTEELKKYINWIQWNASGFTVKATNKLPVGNDITLGITSSFFGISGSSQLIEASGDAGTEQTLLYIGTPKKTWLNDKGSAYGENEAKFDQIDLTADLKFALNHWNPSDKTLTVVDVEPDKTYSISIHVTPEFNWTEANVKMPDSSQTNYTGEICLGINKNTMFDSLQEGLGAKIASKTVPMYLFASIPDDIFEGERTFKGSIESFYSAADSNYYDSMIAGTDNMILGSKDGGGNITKEAIDFKAMPELVLVDGAVKKNAAFGSTPMDFADTLNTTSATGKLCLKYDIGLNGDAVDDITITPAALEGSNSTAIKVDVVLLLKMDFRVTQDITIDLMDKFDKKDKDLFGRDSQPDISSYEQYLDLLTSATVSVQDIKIPIKGDVKLRIENFGSYSGTEPITKNFAIKTNPKSLMETYPLKPEIIILIPESQDIGIGLLKDTNVAGKIKLNITAEGEIPIYPFEGKN